MGEHTRCSGVFTMFDRRSPTSFLPSFDSHHGGTVATMRGRWTMGLLLLGGCAWTPGAEPPTPTPLSYDGASITILDPTVGEAVVARADSSGTVSIAYSVEGVRLAAPGTCSAGDTPCAHVLVRVDGTACDDIAYPWNSASWASPAVARLGLCPGGVDGEHTVELQLVDDQRAAIVGSGGSPISATVQFSASIPSLYERLGGSEGIHDAVETFFAQGMLAYGNVAHYFLNASTDRTQLVHCMASYFGMKAGGPEVYDCRSMAEAHQGRGISGNDWVSFRDAWVAHFAARGVEASDVEELFSQHLTADYSSIVEDVKNYESVYQRVGRWSAIKAIIDDVGNRMVADPILGPFFVMGDPSGAPEYSSRAAFCLSRFVCAIDGPCEYGAEVLHPAVASGPCRDLTALHAGMTSALGEPIGLQHLEAMWLHVEGALGDAGVSPNDIALIQGAFAPRCPEVLADPADCGT